MSRPPEPGNEDTVWFSPDGEHNWECGWDRARDFWTGAGYYACRGGIDLDCITVTAGTWKELLDEVTDHP